MMEVIKLIAVIAVIGGGLWFSYSLGDKNGYMRKENEALKTDNTDLAGALEKKEQEVVAVRAEGKQEQLDLVAMHDLLVQIDKKAGSIGYQMKSALNASNLSLCLYPDDVQRLRAEKSRSTRALIESANDSARSAREAN